MTAGHNYTLAHVIKSEFTSVNGPLMSLSPSQQV